MSTAKRARRRQTEEAQRSTSSSPPPPASKRLKTAAAAHVPPLADAHSASSGLGFLLDDDARAGKRKLQARLTNGVSTSRTTRVDESRAVVASDTRDDVAEEENDDGEVAVGARGTRMTPFEVSSAEESSEDDEEVGDEGYPEAAGGRQAAPGLENGHLAADGIEDGDGEWGRDLAPGAHDETAEGMAVDAEADEEDLAEPSFGDMLRARHPDQIDISASIPHPSHPHQSLIPTRALSAPSATSLGTVLAQALKTNDRELLESCLRTTDVPSIRATISRLQSPPAAQLLQRLAERIHARPGRTGKLMAWVHWTLAAHGAFLATRPELMGQLRALARVIRDRAAGLQPLLRLKGKLNLLSAQLEMRRSVLAASRAADAEDEDAVEKGVVFVEGRDAEWEDLEAGDAAEDEETRTTSLPQVMGERKTALPRTQQPGRDDDSDSDEALPNGVIREQDDDDDDSEDEDEEAEDVLDLEAEEVSDDDDEDEGEVDSDADSDPEVDEDTDPSADAESEEDSGVKPIQPKMLNRKR